MIRTISTIAALLFVTSASAHDFKAGDLVVDHPMSFPTAVTARAGAGYFSVTNTGQEADKLTGVRADFPRVEIHNMEETDGVMKMFPIEAVDIPAGETIMLAPGGMHVMFMGLNGDPFEVGEEIPATLIFEKAGEVDIVFKVEERGESAKEMDHSAHN